MFQLELPADFVRESRGSSSSYDGVLERIASEGNLCISCNFPFPSESHMITLAHRPISSYPRKRRLPRVPVAAEM